MKYQGYADHLNTPYHLKMDDVEYNKLSLADKLQQIPINIVERVQSEISDLVSTFLEKLETLSHIISNPQEAASILDIQGYIKGRMSEDKEKQYGLHKYIIVMTKHKTMFALDTKNSRILWKRNFSNQKSTLVALIKLKQEYEKEVAIAISFLDGNSELIQIHEDGSTKLLKLFRTE